VPKRRSIIEQKWNVPDPASGAFRFKVLLEIQKANVRARELSNFYNNPFKVHRKFQRGGNCSRCGIDWDRFTPGCKACIARRRNRGDKAAPPRDTLAA